MSSTRPVHALARLALAARALAAPALAAPALAASAQTALTLTSLALAALALAATPALAADYTVKLAYVAQPSNPFHAGMEQLAKRVAERSKGAIEIKLFHSQQLGGERDYVEGLQLGTLEMAATSTAILGSFEPRFQILDLPFLFRSPEHLDRVLDGAIGRELADLLPAKGLRLLGYGDTGARYIHNSKRMVKTPEDLKGLKFRVMQNPVHLETYKAMGARAVPMARPEVYSALKQGVLDGLDNALAFYESMGDYEVARYLTLGVQIMQTPNAVLVSEKFYQKLPPELRKALAEGVAETMPYQRKIFREADMVTLERLKKKGVVVDTADPAPFAEAARAVWKEFEDKVGGRARIEAVLAVK
jgi:tripartite ATP-independent transporter DctP family solute receptor